MKLARLDVLGEELCAAVAAADHAGALAAWTALETDLRAHVEEEEQELVPRLLSVSPRQMKELAEWLTKSTNP